MVKEIIAGIAVLWCISLSTQSKGYQNPSQPSNPLPPRRCAAVHETYSEVPALDAYCAQEATGWTLPADAKPRHCVCVTGFMRTTYPDGPCITHIQCLDPPQKTVYRC